MGNYSTDPKVALQSALGQGYSRVRFQQGKPILDRELNLAADLAGPERLAEAYLGDGVPAGGQGFQITALNVGTNDFNILPGRCLVAGREVVLTQQTTYRTQPNNSQVQAFPAGVSNIYLHVFTTEIGSAQDAALNNVGDVGVETTIRERTDWEVLVSAAPINASGFFLLAVLDSGASTVTDRRRSGLTLSSLQDEIGTARGVAPSLNERLSPSLANDGKLKPGIVSIQKMAVVTKFLTQVSVQAAPGPGQAFEQPVTISRTDDPTFLLVSVHFDAPHSGPPNVKFIALQWRQQSILRGIAFDQHEYQILIENRNAFAISVTVKAYALAEI